MNAFRAADNLIEAVGMFSVAPEPLPMRWRTARGVTNEIFRSNADGGIDRDDGRRSCPVPR